MPKICHEKYRWDSAIPRKKLSLAPRSFQSRRFTYYGSSLNYSNRLTRIGKISLTILGSVLLVPIPFIAWSGGYGFAGVWMRELKYGLRIEAKVLKDFDLRTYISPVFLTTAILEEIESLPERGRLLFIDFLKKYLILRDQELSEHDSPWDRTLGVLEDIEMQLVQELRNFKHVFKLVKLCTLQVRPFSQDIFTAFDIFLNHPSGTAERKQNGIQWEIENTKAMALEHNWAKKGFSRPISGINLWEKYTLVPAENNPKAFVLILETRVNPGKYSFVDEGRKKEILIDLSSFKNVEAKVVLLALGRDSETALDHENWKDFKRELDLKIDHALLYLRMRPMTSS